MAEERYVVTQTNKEGDSLLFFERESEEEAWREANDTAARFERGRVWRFTDQDGFVELQQAKAEERQAMVVCPLMPYPYFGTFGDVRTLLSPETRCGEDEFFVREADVFRKLFQEEVAAL